MTRTSYSGELKFDPEIERILHRLRREARQNSAEQASTPKRALVSSSGINIALESVSNGSSSGSEVEEVMAANNRTLNELAAHNLNQQPLCIEYPTLDATFELKSGLIYLLPTFCGLAGEDPHKNLKEFYVVCSNMKS